MGSLNKGLKKTKWLGFSKVCVDLGGAYGVHEMVAFASK